ncbi:MAG: hypothetical protein ACFCU6_10815 [Balneolaceae bacterium]
MAINRCICHDISFAEIKEIAREKNISAIEELQHFNICSKGCMICRPYVAEVLRTGKTSFEPGSVYRKIRKP